MPEHIATTVEDERVAGFLYVGSSFNGGKLDGLHLDMEEHSLYEDCLSGQFKVFCRFCWLPFHQGAIRF